MEEKGKKILTELKKDDRAVVRELEGGENFKKKLVNLGVLQGRELTVISGSSNSPYLIRVGETRVMIGNGMAKKIIVEKL